MSGTTIQNQVRTTLRVCDKIRQSSRFARALSREYKLTPATVRKRESSEAADGGYRPHRLHMEFVSAQEAIAVERQRTSPLPMDKLLVVVRGFIKPDVVRSALQRLVVRHGLSQRQAFIVALEGEPSRKKGFKKYAAGIVHVNIEYLPAMADKELRNYLLVTIKGVSCWLYAERHWESSNKSSVCFLKNPGRRGYSS